LFADPPGVGTSVFWLAAAAMASLTVAVRVVEHREYVLEQ